MRWIATPDSRTRDWHRELDGATAEQEEPFVNSLGEIMYPGDYSADPANVYNCRCSLAYDVVGFRGINGKVVMLDEVDDGKEHENKENALTKPLFQQLRMKAADLEGICNVIFMLQKERAALILINMQQIRRKKNFCLTVIRHL